MIDHIDHIVLTTRDLPACTRFYTEVLGMKLERFRTPTEERLALKFGNQKFNVRPTGRADWWSVEMDAPGALDLCFISRTPMDEILKHLAACGVAVAMGPVQQIGALGPMTSVYCHDPDRNLIEIAVYDAQGSSDGR